MTGNARINRLNALGKRRVFLYFAIIFGSNLFTEIVGGLRYNAIWIAIDMAGMIALALLAVYMMAHWHRKGDAALAKQMSWIRILLIVGLIFKIADLMLDLHGLGYPRHSVYNSSMQADAVDVIAFCMAIVYALLPF